MQHLKKKSSQDSYPTYIKYIGLSFQLFAVIGLGTWLGWYIQGKSQLIFPVWLLLFCFLSIILAFYQLFQSLKNDEKVEDKRKKP
ncbi:AtpZ/AtpI family protein [Belliella buryatensis]|uniref:AtpZ/AtpI family protein n=1 Tax=Belliella buryatensis TaxID=1500549 RepID=UPI000B77D9AC|nr:AtpZ/AtpI family protein [Belliella buryatensis]